MARILDAMDAPVWMAVREMYLQDKVEEAFEGAEALGGLDSNDLYAEAEVRTQGTKFEPRPWLTVEAIESEVGHHLHAIVDLMAQACEALSKRFGWDNREKTLIALLPMDVEAPWMPGRWGYFVDKVPYDKICLPHHLIRDPDELVKTVLHEFMHDITTNLTNGHITRWFSEAMSTYAEGRFDAAALDDWMHSRAEWHTPIELDNLVSQDNRNAQMQREISRAYSQANFVARYLATQGGDSKLGALLTEIGDESVLHNLGNQLIKRSRMDSAVRRVYGITETQLFEQAHAYVLSGPTATP